MKAESSWIHRSSFIVHRSSLPSGYAAIDGLGLLGDHVPAEGRIHCGPPVAAHPAAAVMICKERTDTPTNTVRVVIDLQAIDPVPDELGRPAAFGTDNGLEGTP